jgi:hypothetical protein
MKVDRDFVPLVLKDLNLDLFIHLNLLDSNASGISQVFEFL